MAKATHDELSKLFAKRFEDYNTKVLEDIANIIKQFNGLTYTQAHKLAQQLKYNRSYEKMVNELSKLSGKATKDIESMLEEVVKQNIEFDDIFFKAKNLETPIYENDRILKNIVNTVAEATGGDFVNMSKTTGFAFLDKDNHINFLSMKDTYQKVIDECVYAVSTGKDSFNNVMRNTINQLAESGIRRIVYANDGKKQYTQRIDTAVRRNIMDTIRQINIESNKELGERFRYDGVEVTVHLFPAPDHEKVQGHQFRNDEFKKFQNDKDCIDVKGIEYPAESKETGRDRRSIGQYNCYHGIIPILIGISKPLYTEEQLQKIIDDNEKGVEIDNKHYTLYEATQLQRQIETEIRKSKDAHIMYKTTGDRLGMLKEQKRITLLTQKYNEITKKSNIPNLLKDRARVSGYSPIKSLKPPRELNEDIKEPVITLKNDMFKNVVQGKDIFNIDETDVNEIIKIQGFDGKPILIKDEAEFEKLVNEDTVGMYRGINADSKETITKYKNMLRNGEFITNSGNLSVSGRGLYTSAYSPGDKEAQRIARETAEKYAGFRSMFAEPGTKVDYKETGQVERFTFTKDVKIYVPNENEIILKDYEIAKKGYDAYYNRDGDYVIILNRTKMIILDK